MDAMAQRAPADMHEQMRILEERGLLRRIDRPICKDTELHPLARWMFTGGLPDSARQALLFTNVHGADGRKYDMPVLVGALAASPAIYAAGMGVPVEAIGEVWNRGMAVPIPPEPTTNPPCQEVVIKGDALRAPGGGLAALPVPISTPGFDAAPYFTATLCVTKDPETGVRNMGTYRAALKDLDRLGVRMASRLSGAGGYLHWRKYKAMGQKMPCAIVLGASPIVMFTGPQKLRIDEDEMAVAGGLAGRPIRTCQVPHDRSRNPRRRRDRHRGADRHRIAGAGRPVRREPRPCRARRLQHVDDRHRDHASARRGAHLHRQSGDALRIERDEEGGL